MTPVTLEGELVRLVPLRADHVAALWEAARDSDPFRYFPMRAPVCDVASMGEFVQDLLSRSHSLPFVTMRVPDERIVGATGFWGHDAHHRLVEIGSTWLTRSERRSTTNSEAKLLMLDHAFGPLQCERVELKTDTRNEASWSAMERLGAHREGVLRSHRTMLDGPRRDSVYYSMVAPEWPALRQRLVERIRARR